MHFTHCPIDIFQDLPRCVKLLLDNNQISSVENNAFDGMSSLESLNLHKNSLSVIRNGMFTGLHALVELFLNSNEIDRIVEGSFDPLRSIKRIHLANNKLTSLSQILFLNLPRPLELSLSDHDPSSTKLNCDSLCWLKHEEFHRTITIWGHSYPTCAAHVGGWRSLQCGNSGQCTQFTSFKYLHEPR